MTLSKKATKIAENAKYGNMKLGLPNYTSQISIIL
jgi:hypothetical protein